MAFLKWGFCTGAIRETGVHMQTSIMKPLEKVPVDFWKSGGHSSSAPLQ